MYVTSVGIGIFWSCLDHTRKKQQGTLISNQILIETAAKKTFLFFPKVKM